MKLAVYCFMSYEDIAHAETLAVARNGCKEHGVNHKLKADRTDQETHTIGAIGELAVAKLLGGTLDETARPGGDDGRPDVLLPDGKGVNVKTRIRKGYDFLLDPGQQELGADYGVLCWLVGGKLTVEVAGWCTNTDLKRHGKPKDFGYGVRLALDADLLRPITGLIAHYQKG